MSNNILMLTDGVVTPEIVTDTGPSASEIRKHLISLGVSGPGLDAAVRAAMGQSVQTTKAKPSKAPLAQRMAGRRDTLTKIGSQVDLYDVEGSLQGSAADFTIQSARLIVDGIGPVNDHLAIVRSGNGKIQGEERILSYGGTLRAGGIVQPVEFVRAAVAIAKDIGSTDVRVTSLQNGRLLSVQIGLGERKLLGDPSPCEAFLTFLACYDGTRTTQAGISHVRIVCQNTFNMASREMKNDDTTLTHKATPGLAEFVAFLGQSVRPALADLASYENTLNRMTEVRMLDADMRTFAGTLFKRENDRDDLVSLFHSGTGVEGAVRGTVYAAWQAVTEYADHVSQVKANTDSVFSSAFGPQAARKASAFKVLSALL